MQQQSVQSMTDTLSDIQTELRKQLPFKQANSALITKRKITLYKKTPTWWETTPDPKIASNERKDSLTKESAITEQTEDPNTIGVTKTVQGSKKEQMAGESPAQ